MVRAIEFFVTAAPYFDCGGVTSNWHVVLRITRFDKIMAGRDYVCFQLDTYFAQSWTYLRSQSYGPSKHCATTVRHLTLGTSSLPFFYPALAIPELHSRSCSRSVNRHHLEAKPCGCQAINIHFHRKVCLCKGTKQHPSSSTLQPPTSRDSYLRYVAIFHHLTCSSAHTYYTWLSTSSLTHLDNPYFLARTAAVIIDLDTWYIF